MAGGIVGCMRSVSSWAAASGCTSIWTPAWGRAGFYYKKRRRLPRCGSWWTSSGIEIVGLMTHFPCADAEDLTPRRW